MEKTRSFRRVAKNESFVDYMLRRASDGVYDKRTDDTTSVNQQVKSSDATNNKGVRSAIETMSGRLSVKLDFIYSDVKLSNEQLKSINKYSEDSSIWLGEIYDLLDKQGNTENKKKLNEKSKFLENSDINKPKENNGDGGGSLGNIVGATVGGAAGGAALRAGSAAGGAALRGVAAGALALLEGAGELAAGAAAIIATPEILIGAAVLAAIAATSYGVYKVFGGGQENVPGVDAIPMPDQSKNPGKNDVNKSLMMDIQQRSAQRRINRITGDDLSGDRDRQDQDVTSMQWADQMTPTSASPALNNTSYSSTNADPDTLSSPSGVGDVTAFGGGGGSRPAYPLSEEDLHQDVVNVIAGEVSTSNQEGVDAVINTMMNRVGTGGAWGPDGNLHQVATARGQFAGYRRASESETEYVRGRIKAIASGSVPDNTKGADSYRASSYVFGEGAGKTFARLASSQGNVNIGGNIFAKDPKAPIGAYVSPGVGGKKSDAVTAKATASSAPSLSPSAKSASSNGGNSNKSSGNMVSGFGAVGKLAGNLIGNLSKSTSLKSAAQQFAAVASGGSGGALSSVGGTSQSKSSKLPTGGSSNPLPAIDNMFAKLFDESAMFG